MRFNPPLHLTLSLCLLLLGLGLLLTIPWDLARADEIARLPLADAQLLGQAAPGTRVAIDGRISGRSTVVYRGFVAYVREQYRQRSWVMLERATPPLWLLVGDEHIAVVNNDYSFEQAALTIREAEPTAFAGAVRARGFLLDSPALVIGSVVTGAAGPGIVAEYLWPGSRADYLHTLREPVGRMLWFGGAASLVGAAWMAIGIAQLRQFLREPPTPPVARPRAPRQRGRRA